MDKNRNNNRSRKNGIILYLNDQEKFILDEKTKLSGMKSRAAFLRQMIVYGFVYDVDYDELHEYNVQLSKIGTNINQIARRVNGTGSIYSEDVKELQKLMEEIWHNVAISHAAKKLVRLIYHLQTTGEEYIPTTT